MSTTIARNGLHSLLGDQFVMNIIHVEAFEANLGAPNMRNPNPWFSRWIQPEDLPSDGIVDFPSRFLPRQLYVFSYAYVVRMNTLFAAE
jgi:hypothetical protein